ncbi:hypothetical protein [Thiorhodovibrio frisius]|uniref:hypothetical protein n=1 Tax=Thiorhodovibrio frisius TaxID=631362 RepID=UPI00022C6A03|nr:hypothetical protein [Thiorhodovibrio frisius]
MTAETFDALKARLAPLCHSTLRRQFTQYVPYTARHALVEEFTPEDSEDQLYQLVSDDLGRDNLFALPPAQRTLMTLVLRKLLDFRHRRRLADHGPPSETGYGRTRKPLPGR